jgi:hypothetical protein
MPLKKSGNSKGQEHLLPCLHQSDYAYAIFTIKLRLGPANLELHLNG